MFQFSYSYDLSLSIECIFFEEEMNVFDKNIKKRKKTEETIMFIHSIKYI